MSSNFDPLNNRSPFADDAWQVSDPYRSPSILPLEGSGAELKHSGLGIASFVMSVLIGLSMFASIAAAGIMQATTPEEIDDKSPIAIVLGLAIIALMLLSLVAIGLGIGGLMVSNRKRIFAILGLTFSALTVGGTVALMVIGASMK